MSTRDKWVRRFTVDETARHKNGFTIYKITSVLFPLESPEAVSVVSVWKRYSDAQRLQRNMRALHAGLHLRGSFPALPKNSYFKRFQPEVIAERAKSIKTLLEFIAEHRLLFTSTDFVNFLQTGYPEPTPLGGVINAIRSSLHLPIEETPPLEYQTSDDEARSPAHSSRTAQEAVHSNTNSGTDVNRELDVSQIPIYEAANVEIRESPKRCISKTESYESITSIDSISSDFYNELSKVKIEKTKPSVKTKTVLPDLINFDAPSTSRSSIFDDYHTMRTHMDAETVSNSTCDSSNIVRVKEMENSYVFESPLYDASLSNSNAGELVRECGSEVSLSSGALPSLSGAVRVSETEDSYVYESPLYDASLSNAGELVRECGSEVSLCSGALPSLSGAVRVSETEDSYVYEGLLYDASASLSNAGVGDECAAGVSRECGSEVSGVLSSLSGAVRASETEDSYVFEAGYLVALAARCEERSQYRRAFHCYRAGIEKMLIGAKSDPDAQRRAIIKQKINKYLSYAEEIYKNHLCDADDNLLSDTEEPASLALCPPPISMLRRPYEDLSLYRVLDILGSSVMLVLHRTEQTCYAMKVIRKIPHNLTEFDEYFMQRTNETRQPILPTLIPYMVTLQAYIETTNLIFLILSYAPGKKLFDYIKDYTKSLPTTPSREVNLENVFTEPSKQKRIDIVNDNLDEVDSTSRTITTVTNIQDVNENVDTKTEKLDNAELSVNELVINSQKLLQNVDKVLTETPKIVKNDVEEKRGDVKLEVSRETGRTASKETVERRTIEAPLMNRLALPAGAACGWAAQLLVALDGLHNCGVICRDLSPRNILLGDRGQIILTYFVHYPGSDMALAQLRTLRGRGGGERALHVAPELLREVFRDADRACDFWSYGAILYELLCGVPLSFYHRSAFTSHTILQLPDGLSLEVQSLLTQLLTYEPSQRLGAGKDGIAEIMQHPYFRGVDWRRLRDAWSAPR